ncbi:MAG TPA: RcpC/CpaB family pilus assembly protein [Pseudolysinimonas sp.]
MRIRIIGAVIAVVLAAVGAVALWLYVRDADLRAADGAEFVNVYVVSDEAVPKGTPGEEIGGYVSVERLPKIAVQADRVTSLSDLVGLVATAEILPGEQLVNARFIDPVLLAAHGDVTVPDGMQEVTIALPVEQAGGGVLVAGSTVGVVITAGINSKNDDLSTAFALHKVLVTRVQAGNTFATTPEDTSTPVSTIMVTLALETTDVQRVVWAAELQQDNSAGIWLTLEPDTATEGEQKIIGANNIFGENEVGE